MKSTLSIVCFLLSSCTMTNQPNIKVMAEVTDSTANERLLLNFVEVPVPEAQSREKFYDFYSLIWETKVRENWVPKVTISRDDFQRGSNRRRWISKIHSLNSDKEYAIIKVGEEGTPNKAGVVHVIYSWRKWNLVKNEEIDMLQICEDPFDEFDESNEGI